MKLVSLAKLVNLVKPLKLVKYDTAHLAECILGLAYMASVLPSMAEEKHRLPNRLLSLNLAWTLQCSDICTTPFQRPVAWQIWPRPHNTQKFSTKLNYIRLEVRGPPAQAVKTSDTDGQGKSGRRICSPPCRTADCTGLGSWCMESRTKTWARAMFFSSEIGMRVVHLVQAGREHCIDWLVEDERRAATSSSSNPSQANSTHPTHKRASRIKSGKRGLVQATGYAINSTIFFMHFPLL